MPEDTTTIKSGCNDNLFNTFNTKYFDATDTNKVDAELIKTNYEHIIL
ncbi:hypothetical protein [Myroides pelagicus]|uniref:Uncharacterized protein n=1 Tax=Myroides pelagicus TaxID=270914 RepID=A0A7K1GRG4_9FLAO|nr:hypothetical protein [Myroides pelagicus]MTH30823.1 hypothetical protein [Myroides pelagicus]